MFPSPISISWDRSAGVTRAEMMTRFSSYGMRRLLIGRNNAMELQYSANARGVSS